jgi:hypothetical protein
MVSAGCRSRRSGIRRTHSGADGLDGAPARQALAPLQRLLLARTLVSPANVIRARARTLSAPGARARDRPRVGCPDRADMLRAVGALANAFWSDQPLQGAEQFVGDDQESDRIVARATSRVANHMRAAFEASVFGGIRARIHAGEESQNGGPAAAEALWITKAIEEFQSGMSCVSESSVKSLSSRYRST